MKTLSFAPALMLTMILTPAWLVPAASALAQDMPPGPVPKPIQQPIRQPVQQPAQSPPEGQVYLPTPNIPASPYPGEGIEPEVTITETETEVVTEYRIKGKLYMVKIDPLTGPAYYLFDTDGDGTLDRDDPPGPNLSVPQWLLFSW